MAEPILKIEDLHVHFPIKSGSITGKTKYVKAVNGISLAVNEGETFGVVGESGCGKSTLARTIVGLEKPTSGRILFDGEDITTFNSKEMHEFRRQVQMVFQDPYTSLNPRMKIGDIIAAPLKAFKIKMNIKSRVKELMELVGLDPEDHFNRYPHEFSGGQRQRIGIARALALDPKLLICDEPVSALDVSIQSQIINLFEDLQKEFNLSYLFIAHDLSVVEHISDEIAVMYLGKNMEISNSKTFYNDARHPYTKSLLSAIPLPDPGLEKKRQQIVLEGELPSPVNPPSGCVFHTRCPIAQESCKVHEPQLEDIQGDGHAVACFYPETDISKFQLKI